MRLTDRSKMIIIGGILVILVCPTLYLYLCKSYDANEPHLKQLPEKALVLHTIGGYRVGIANQNIIANATEIVRREDEKSVRLNEKLVGVDEIDMEELYVIFKHENLPGYYVVVLSPEQITARSGGFIDVDYVGIREIDNTKYLEIKYKSNINFSIKLLYTRYPEFKEFSGLYPSTRHIFYAYPVKTLAKADVSLSWKEISIELESGLDETSKKIDIAQEFLMKLDEIWRYNGSKEMFLWDEHKISKNSAEEIIKSFKGEYKPSIRYLNYDKHSFEFTRLAPILSQEITVITKENKKVFGEIWISVIEENDFEGGDIS